MQSRPARQNKAKVVNLESRLSENSTHRRFSAFAREGNVRTEVVWGKPFHQPLPYRATSQTASTSKSSRAIRTRTGHLLASSRGSGASVSWATAVYITNALIRSCMCNWGWEADFMCGRNRISLVRVRAFENASPAATFSPTEPLNYGFMHECAGLP